MKRRERLLAMDNSRIEFLQQALDANPGDRFARYALAMEFSNSERPEEAWKHFQYLLERHPEYSPSYLQAGLYLVRRGRPEEARGILQKGVEVTQREGNLHAQGEIQAVLDDLDQSSR
ncbi:MAG: tetratricopeptide repeat protein [Terriglobia bacterium]